MKKTIATTKNKKISRTTKQLQYGKISEDLLYTNNIFIKKIPLPANVKGFCTIKGGSNIICINQDLSDEMQIETAYHEINHILSNHLDSDEDVRLLENS